MIILQILTATAIGSAALCSHNAIIPTVNRRHTVSHRAEHCDHATGDVDARMCRWRGVHDDDVHSRLNVYVWRHRCCCRTNAA